MREDAPISPATTTRSSPSKRSPQPNSIYSEEVSPVIDPEAACGKEGFWYRIKKSGAYTRDVAKQILSSYVRTKIRWTAAPI